MTAPPFIPSDATRGRNATTTIEQFRDRPALAQVDVAANADTTLYTCPKGRMANVRVHYCERNGAVATIRIYIQDDGAALDVKQYICFDYPILANEAGSFGPFQLGADDVVTVRASTTDVSFTANGYDRPRDTT